MNIQFCKSLIEKLFYFGVEEYIICAGARNAPFVKLIPQAQGIQSYSFFEERSAGFFALGKIKSKNKPVAVITTSGTAVGNLLPPIMEAFYQGLPFIVISADRPKSYRGTGAPQVAEQVGIFSHYAKTFDFDIEDFKNNNISNLESELEQLNSPLHLNICFDEPLIDEEIVPLNFQQLESFYKPKVFSVSPKRDLVDKAIENFNKKNQRPLVIVSALKKNQAEALQPFIDKLTIPVYLEAHSNMLIKNKYVLTGGEITLKELKQKSLIDSVIRIGGIPTVRLWRDLEVLKLPILQFSELKFTGLSYVKDETLPLIDLLELNSSFKHEKLDEVIEINRECEAKLLKQIIEFPRSEVSMIKKIVEIIPPEDQIFIGNSLAIRELDLVAPQLKISNEVISQRGLNGIDGLISTSLGLCKKNITTWAILGDLTVLYDLSGFWQKLKDPTLKIKLIIVNNGGGKIFQKIFSDPHFENRHGLDFKSLADFWKLKYLKLDHTDFSFNEVFNVDIIELIPEQRTSKLFWNDL